MEARNSAIEDNRVKADANIKVDDSAIIDPKAYLYLVTVEQAEEDEESLIESIRRERSSSW